MTVVACVQFVTLTIVAGFLYGGGTYDDPTTMGYSLFNNFLSDLGLTETFLGKSNLASSLLFTTALSLAGTCLVLFFVALPHLFIGAGVGRYLSVSGSICGVISGASYVGVAFAPANRCFGLHMNLIYVASFSYFITATLYSIAIFLNQDYSNLFAFIFMASAVVLGAYMLFWVFGPENLTVQATGQQIVVYGQIACMFTQAFGGWKSHKFSSTKPTS
jgi:hypothetical protein